MSESKIVLTTCTRDCPDTCGINARVVGGRLVALNGVREHDITRSFLCRKAVDYMRRVYSGERLLKPVRKVDGQWQEMSWDEAFTLVAALTKNTIDEYGSLAILHYQSAGSIGALKMLNKRFFNLLGGVTEAAGSLCGGAAIAGQTLDFGKRESHDPNDLLNSRLILLWGRNPADTNPHLVPILKSAKSQGAKIILIDPLVTGTKRFCDMQVRPRPGMDGYLALAIAKAIIQSGNADEGFLQEHTDNTDAFLEMLKSQDMAELSAMSGVPVDEIEQLARLYAGHKPAAVVCGWGLQRYQWGAETFRLIDALGAVTGNFGVAGGGVSHGRDNDGLFNQAVKGKEFAQHSRTIPKPLLATALRETQDPPVKMAFINGANPLNQSPDAPAVAGAFKDLDYVVVVEQFMTDTAEAADIVLPATTYLEETDVVASFWHGFIGPVNPAIEPVGEAKSDFEIFQELANRLGVGEEMAGSADEWLERILEPLKGEGITLASLREGHRRIPNLPAVPYEGGVFPTESGRLNLVTSFSQPQLGSDEYPLILLTPHSRRWVHSQILPHDHDAPLEAKVNPETAAANGIEDGGAATVVSEAGSLAVVVRHDEGVPVGVVSIEQGRWMKYHQSVNQLTSPIMSFEGDNACYYQTTVRLVR
ncbi:MAG: molybdopterin-dependent oxidoreductase [Candidatus Aquicultor sp.]|nr:molybdopterin-dependent oxidoreductase [Candidatus Aquicultor sp.]